MSLSKLMTASALFLYFVASGPNFAVAQQEYRGHGVIGNDLGDQHSHYREIKCPERMGVIGIHGRSGKYVDSLGLECADINALYGGRPYGKYNTQALGGSGGRDFRSACPTSSNPALRYAAVGLYGAGGKYVDSVGITCSRIFLKPHGGAANSAGTASAGYDFQTEDCQQFGQCPKGNRAGGPGGRASETGCAANTFMTGIALWPGKYVDGVRVICRKFFFVGN